MRHLGSLPGSTNLSPALAAATTAELGTTEDVTIVVRHASPPVNACPPRKEEPRKQEDAPRVVVAPPPEALALNEVMKQLWKEHGAFMQRSLLRRGDIVPESVKDVMQEVLLTAGNRITKHGVPEKVRAFLVALMRNEVRNHLKLWRPRIDHEVEHEAQRSFARDPEEQAQLAELWVKLERYIAHLTPGQAEVFQARAFDGLTIEEVAELVGRSRATVAYQYDGAVEALSELADKSRRRADRRRRS